MGPGAVPGDAATRLKHVPCTAPANFEVTRTPRALRAARALRAPSAPHGAAAAAVNMERDGLIARLNAYMGPGAVARIAIIQMGRASAPSSAVPEKLEAEGELGSALASFRTAVRRRNGGN